MFFFYPIISKCSSVMQARIICVQYFFSCSLSILLLLILLVYKATFSPCKKKNIYRLSAVNTKNYFAYTISVTDISCVLWVLLCIFKITHFVILGIYHIVSCYLMMCQLQCLSNRFWKKEIQKQYLTLWKRNYKYYHDYYLLLCDGLFLCHCFHHGGMVFGTQVLGTYLICSSLSFSS